MIDFNKKTKLTIDYSKTFKKQLKKIIKQNKDLNLLKEVIYILANNENLPKKYKNHRLIDDNEYKNCYECHIKPDWLLIYQKNEDELILILVATGSHSELF